MLPCSQGLSAFTYNMYPSDFGSCWISMPKRLSAPSTLEPSITKALVFIEARTSQPFTFRGHRIIRTGWPFSHGLVITATACQGRTLHRGVIVDCGRHEGGTTPKGDEDWSLDLYVMLSRATRLEDLLLFRAPPSSFLLQGPPASLRHQLTMFAARVEGCRVSAEHLAVTLGLEAFLH